MLGVAMLLVNELERCGFDVIKTGFDDSDAYDDEDTALKKRQQTIKNAECECSVSIHFNAYGDGVSFNTAKGVGIYIHSHYPKDSKLFVTKVLNQLSQGTKASILVECAFMTNQKEAVNMMGGMDFWEETAAEIAKGVCDYTGVTYVEKEYENKSNSDNIYKVQIGAFRNKSNADKMLVKARNGEIDLIITKSVSRFGRNTDTILKTVRELGVSIFFEEQNINTISGDGEVLLTVLSSLAQEDSRRSYNKSETGRDCPNDL
jgi:hypothetical protein